MIVAVVGEGQLAKCIAQEFPGETGIIGHDRIDIVSCRGFDILDNLAPDVIVNTSAFHDPRACEADMEKAVAVNYHGVRNLVEKADDMGVRLIHIGTDYAYNGSGKLLITEKHRMRPVNVYGATKAYGMHFVLGAGHIVVNLSSLWSRWPSKGKGTNFVLTMAEKARKGEIAKVVDDIVTSFTYGPHAAKAIRFIIEQNRAGMYNAVNDGAASWWKFARAIYGLCGADPDWVKPIQYSDDVPRPRYSALSSAKLASLGFNMPTWKASLREFFMGAAGASGAGRMAGMPA